MEKNNIELLAPVGNMESLYAAIQNGADAVYLGGKMFSARQYANNFNDEELKRAVEYAHIRNVKVYVTVNILIDDKEMKETLNHIRYLYEIDVDGLIVQDLGLANLVRRIFPDFELHGSTQMTVNNLPGAIFLQRLGFKRVVLAREVPIDEVKYIHDNSDIQLEGFIHGALCICYSGQCLMSSLLGGRSGNRGRCAQPCRMPYSLVDYWTRAEVFSSWNNKHLLSPKDLNTLDYLDYIIHSGIVSLKIEGRMKRPEYVATVVKNYRKALDEGKGSITKRDRDDITQIFNRGFTKGYMMNAFGREAISYDRPDNRGILVGEVIESKGDDIYIELLQGLEEGDGIEFETLDGGKTGMVVNFKGDKGKVIKIENSPNITKGSKVYRTSSVELLKRARKSYQQDYINYPVDMEVFITIGKPAILHLNYEDFKITVQSSRPVEKAKRVALNEERVIEQLSKLNDTVYYLNNIQIQLDKGAFMAIKDINEMRREAIGLLDKRQKNKNSREPISDEKYEILINKHLKLESRVVPSMKKISVSVKSKKQFEQLNLNKLDRIYIGFDDTLEEVLLEAKAKNVEAYLVTDRILYREGLDILKENIATMVDLIDGVSVSNIGILQFLIDNFNTDIHGGAGLNAFNSYTVELLKDYGVKSITLSPELNMKQIQNIIKRDGVLYESIGYGYIPLMITKHCPMALVKDCHGDKDCNTCPYSRGYGLRDRKGIDFYMERVKDCTTVYNSVPLMMLEHIHQIYNNGVDMIRLDFTFENEGIREIQEIYYDYANNRVGKEVVNKFIQDYRIKNYITKGHYFRGVI